MATKSLTGDKSSTNQDSANQTPSGGDAQQAWLDRGKKVLMDTYASFPVVLTQGKGSYVEDAIGKRYLDFVAGIAVNALGHCDEDYVQAMTEQLSKMVHCSNLYLNTPAIELAEKLLDGSAFDRAFFCNSGAEAIEGSLKLSRKYAREAKGEHCTKILTMSNSFHGRTYGALSATAQTKYHSGYQPLVPEIEAVPFNDINAIKAMDLSQVAAIIVEPIQGEGGVHPVDQTFIIELRKLCTDEKIVLIFDEIQCGVGRTGKFFAHENLAMAPDIVALAKGLGGGFPIGSILATQEVASAFKHGDHGTTFGGNPLACTAALTCVNKIKQPEFLAAVKSKGDLLHSSLKKLKEQNSEVKEIRGAGLMVGIELDSPVKPVIAKCLENGLLLVGAGEKVIRMLPPLTVSEKEIESAVDILASALVVHSDV